MKEKEYLRLLINEEKLQMQKLETIVKDSIEEESNISALVTGMESNDELTIGEKLADRIASFGGSWKFIILFLMFLLLWICINVFVFINKGFDPYPFILLNLILSCIAALQAPLIMMSQNRQEAKDRLRAKQDYMVNLKAEIEIRNLHLKLDLSIIDHYKHLCDIQQKQIELLEKILADLNKK